MYHMRKLAVSGVLALTLVGCASADEPLAQPDSTTTTTSQQPSTTNTEEPTLQTSPPSDTELLALAAEARADLADHLGIQEEEIAITEAAAVTWNDGSIGCPQPDMSYTQALVDGARVTLMHDETTYAYHQGGGGLFLCEQPSEGSFVVSKDDTGELEMVPPPGFND